MIKINNRICAMPGCDEKPTVFLGKENIYLCSNHNRLRVKSLYGHYYE